MSGWLLDTNLLSELVRAEPDAAAVAFVDAAEPAFVSAVSMHELRFGVERLPQGRRRGELEGWLAGLAGSYRNRILAVDTAEAEAAARLRATAAAQGRTVSLADGLIAGTALHHGLAVATRNVSDFQDLDIVVVDPWRAPPMHPR